MWTVLHPGEKEGEEVEEAASRVIRKQGLLLQWGLQSGVQRGCRHIPHPPQASIKLPYLISWPWAISKERPL